MREPQFHGVSLGSLVETGTAWRRTKFGHTARAMRGRERADIFTQQHSQPFNLFRLGPWGELFAGPFRAPLMAVALSLGL